MKKIIKTLWQSVLYAILNVFRVWQFKDGFNINGNFRALNKNRRFFKIIPKWWAFVYPSTYEPQYADAAIVDPLYREVLTAPKNTALRVQLERHEESHLKWFKLQPIRKMLNYIYWALKYSYRRNPVEVIARLAEVQIEAGIGHKKVVFACECKNILTVEFGKLRVDCDRCNRIHII